MVTIARLLMVFGLILLVAGGVLYVGARIGLWQRLPLGRVPGDLHIQSGNFTLFIPLATSILLSILLTLLLNLFIRLIRK
jgi:hypothetical protein